MTQPCLDEQWINDSTAKVLANMREVVFTADDLHRLLDEPMAPAKWGLLFKHLGPHLELAGYCRSNRPERRGGLIRQWRLKE